MTKIRRRALGLAASITLLAPGAAFVAAPAAIAGTQCTSASINPHKPLPGGHSPLDPYHLVDRTMVNIGGARADLYQGKDRFGTQYVFAQIKGHTRATRGSDRVWMDVDRNGDRNPEEQCGPFSVGTAGTTGFTRAEPTVDNPRVAMRACGDYVPPSGGHQHWCGPWW